MINLAILGITGRMGQTLLRALPEAQNLKLTGALASPRNPAIGRGGDTKRVGLEAIDSQQRVMVRPVLAFDQEPLRVGIHGRDHRRTGNWTVLAW